MRPGHNGSSRNGRQTARRSRPGQDRKIRFAVVGAGHIAQNAVLPAFANAGKDCHPVALFSNDARKRAVLARRYRLEHALDYADYRRACRAALFDAVYICLPNHLHRDFAVEAADSGIHVLCEKPMAVTSKECRDMIDAARASDVRLMIAYRLHFEKANMSAVDLARDGRLGDLRYFTSTFSMQVRPGNIRLSAGHGGGPLLDIGIYCINAARYLFRDNPTEVVAAAARGRDPRFAEVHEAVAATLRFPGERLASFTCSFGAADTSGYRIVGTKGDLVVDPAFEYEGSLEHCLTIDGRTRERSFPRRDQFAPQLIYFARCVREHIDPEPGGLEGLLDVMIIEAIEESIRSGRAIPLERLPREPAPSGRQEHRSPPSRKRPLVHAQPAHME